MSEKQFLKVSHAEQTMSLYEDDNIVVTYTVSTAKNGLGEENGSEKTPRGWHELADKIGKGATKCAVFNARELTGEICDAALKHAYPERDWILTRIIRLRGLEQGRNQGEGVDSYDRYIYIHGTPYEDVLGEPHSKGCIRMSNDDIIDLFARVPSGTKLYIGE